MSSPSVASEDGSRDGKTSTLPLLRNCHRRILPRPDGSQRQKVRRSSKAFRPVWLPMIQEKTPSQCPLTLCRIEHCRLRSHHGYKSWLQEKSMRRASEDDLSTSSSSSEISHFGPSEASDCSVIHEGLDGMPTLPLVGNVIHQSVLRGLLNIFFVHEWDRVATIVSPPPISDMQKRLAEAVKRNKVALAFTEPVFCLSYIAAAHFPISFREGYRQYDRITTILQIQIMSLLRERMSQKHNLSAHDIVLILAIIMIEIATGHTESLLVHRQAMKHLVEKLGGIHYMGECIPFISIMDRIFCIFANTPLCFPPLLQKPVRRPYQNPHVYGDFLESQECANINQAVIEYCFDSCRVIELLEAKGWTFSPANELLDVVPDLHYMYYLRECLANDFAHLNSQHFHEGQGMDRCILLTARIVDYTVGQDNYIIAIPFHLAKNVRDILSARLVDLSSSPQNCDILRWSLFVLSSMPIPWEGRQWALNALKQQLDFRYAAAAAAAATVSPSSYEDFDVNSNENSSWRSNWRALELKNVQSFVWSNTRLLASWEKTCDELEGEFRIAEIES